MNRQAILVRGIAGLTLALASLSLAQETQPGEGAAACAACGVLTGGLIIIPIIILALNIALLVWVAKDAKARGMDSSVLWMVLVMVTSVIGLVIYLFSRPAGNLVPCAHCGNKKLEASEKCPHCGRA